jgi:PTH2 family peptidyl-tRNA hydrolase
MKQVIALRKDLNMRKGKMVAQGAHASMKVFFDNMVHYQEDLETPPAFHFYPEFSKKVKPWVKGTFTKAVVGVESEAELLGIYEKAKAAGLLCSLIQDIGATEFHGIPTYTAVAVGPGKREDIDIITGHLKLL